MSTRRLAAVAGFASLLILAACTQSTGSPRDLDAPVAPGVSTGGTSGGASARDAAAPAGGAEAVDPAGASAPAVTVARARGFMRPAPRSDVWDRPGASSTEGAGSGTSVDTPPSAAIGDLAGAAEPADQAAVEAGPARAAVTDRSSGAVNQEPPRAAARVSRARTVAIDPGHGGPEPGAAAAGFAEADVNLQIGRYLRDMLQEAGYRAVMTRDSRGGASPAYTAPGRPGQVKDLQARVDIANEAGADLFLSIHNNGSVDPNVRGTEVWFNNARPFSDRNRALAQMVLDGILGRLRAAGHPTVNRGIQDDANWRVFNGRRVFIFVLSSSQTRAATQMPAALGESLFVSNPIDAAALRRSDIQWAIAAGYRDAVFAYFDRFGS